MNSQIVAQRLLRWFEQYGRHSLPWRKRRTPYRVWVSECILQQTQVSRGAPYFSKILLRYPSLKSLASAEEGELLGLWRGLGYYSRARNMLRTARRVRVEFGGRFPREHRLLRSLPGIGEYTASALRSFAFEERAIAWDTNINRIAARFMGVAGARTWLEEVFEALPAKQSYLLNYALMDIGSSLCRAREVRCEACPLLPCGCKSAHKPLARESKSIVNTQRATSFETIPELYEGSTPVPKKRVRGIPLSPVLRHQRKSDFRAVVREYFRKKLETEVSVRPPYKAELRGNVLRMHCRCRWIGGKRLE